MLADLTDIMNSFSKFYENTVLKHPIIVLAVHALLLLFFSCHVRNFKLDASPDTLLLEDDKDLKAYREICERYSVKSFLVVTFSPYDDLFSEKSLDLLKKLRDELKHLDRIDSITTLLDIPLLKTSGVKLTEITANNIKTLADPSVDRQMAKQEILDSPIYQNLILSPDGQTTAIIINLKTDSHFFELLNKRNDLLAKKRAAKLTKSEKAQLKKTVAEYEDYYAFLNNQQHSDIGKIRSVIQPYKEYGVVYLGGMPMIADDMVSFIKNDLMLFGFGVFIFIVITLIIIFRETRWVFLPLLCCFFSVLIMIGMLGLLNWKVTIISSNFISLMLILTMSMNIHLAVRYRQLCREMSTETQLSIVTVMVRKMVLPCLYTALTTILAFSSLVFSGIKPVIDFGWMMTIGLAVTFLTSFLLFPAVLLLLKKSPPLTDEKTHSAFTSMLAELARSHGGKVIFISLLFAVVSAIGITKLKVENSFINYFREKTEIYQGLKLIDDKLGGTAPLDIILKFGEKQKDRMPDKNLSETDEDDFDWVVDYDPSDYWITPFKVKRIEEVQDYLESFPAVGKVLSLASVVRAAEQLNGGKEFDGLELGVLYKKIPEEIKTEILDHYVSVEYNEARISLFVLDSLKNLRRKELLEKIRNGLVNKLGFSENRFTIAGMLVLYNNMLQSLFRSQILTLGIVLAGIALMLFILFRSIILSIIGIIPNLLAVGIVLGIMGLLNIPLDLMTITIAAITMGIAIDNSIHYIYRFKEEFAENGNYAETLQLCHENVGKAILNTSVTIIFGFSILILSNFIPTLYFGIFTGLAMFMAMLAILILLPRLILIWQPFKN